ncbi:MAG: winged helix-turn-helix domain-containing protein [Lachnospiraceae bacterium]|nr:winged helix-turn-helix domain-containing protein [Lachnospiraceae bacterium]
MEFDDTDMSIFDELMEVVRKHPDFNRYEVRLKSALQLPGLEIYPDRRKIYRDRREISLTAKEFDILCFLAANQGKVMTYAQIYEKVWGGYGQDIENNTIGYHICHLKEKLFAASPCSSFNIRCFQRWKRMRNAINRSMRRKCGRKA